MGGVFTRLDTFRSVTKPLCTLGRDGAQIAARHPGIGGRIVGSKRAEKSRAPLAGSFGGKDVSRDASLTLIFILRKSNRRGTVLVGT